jgi:hypothetical protein
MSDPRYRMFSRQRCQAAQRGIPWKFEYWEWLQVWDESGHFHERGVRKGQWVMARLRDQGAYETGNVRIVRCETNASEGVLKHWAEVKSA